MSDGEKQYLMQKINSIGDASQVAQRRESQNRAEPTLRLCNREKQERDVQKRQPRKSERNQFDPVIPSRMKRYNRSADQEHAERRPKITPVLSQPSSGS